MSRSALGIRGILEALAGIVPILVPEGSPLPFLTLGFWGCPFPLPI
jgi:hypothetical protein